MKKILLFGLVLLLSPKVNSQVFNWQPYGQQPNGATSFAINSAQTKLYKGTYYSGCYMSLDSGMTWTAITPAPAGSVKNIVVRGDTLFSSTNYAIWGIKYSVNDGATWTRIDNHFADTMPVYHMALNQTTIFAAAYDAIFKSDDVGQTWQYYLTPHSATDGAYSASASGNNICIGSRGKVYLSNNNGNTWNSKTIPGAAGVPAWAVSVFGNRIFAGTGTGLFLSVDNGTTWTQVGLAGKNVIGLKLFDNFGFAGTDDSQGNPEIYFSNDSGSTWNLNSMGIGNSSQGVECFINFNNKIIAGGWGIETWYNAFYTAVSEIPYDSEKLKIYPNPSKDYFTIKNPFDSQSSLLIYTADGREVIRENNLTAGEEFTLDAHDLASGFYILKIIDRNNVVLNRKISVMK